MLFSYLNDFKSSEKIGLRQFQRMFIRVGSEEEGLVEFTRSEREKMEEEEVVVEKMMRVIRMQMRMESQFEFMR